MLDMLIPYIIPYLSDKAFNMADIQEEYSSFN